MDQVEGRRGDERRPEGRNGVRQPRHGQPAQLAERLAGARLSGSRSLPGFDQDLLGRACFYKNAHDAAQHAWDIRQILAYVDTAAPPA
ncbi:hypothetical protein [Streptomyces litchfieldiae]|uniref:Uncharacterized protein n=1 Tax=Streptomyces litchfieldiae TaxID=3075543 RepID=A0ABU2N446_9ACTN|nr:hypothetical protein [Streptomyces sp. DSM 44938]MDT0347499.1 hypothetical protein [Streptomyces sp. DSM 44938]